MKTGGVWIEGRGWVYPLVASFTVQFLDDEWEEIKEHSAYYVTGDRMIDLLCSYVAEHEAIAAEQLEPLGTVIAGCKVHVEVCYVA